MQIALVRGSFGFFCQKVHKIAKRGGGVDSGSIGEIVINIGYFGFSLWFRIE